MWIAAINLEQSSATTRSTSTIRKNHPLLQPNIKPGGSLRHQPCQLGICEVGCLICEVRGLFLGLCDLHGLVGALPKLQSIFSRLADFSNRRIRRGQLSLNGFFDVLLHFVYV